MEEYKVFIGPRYEVHQIGWACPICGKVYAPFVPACLNCPEESRGDWRKALSDLVSTIEQQDIVWEKVHADLERMNELSQKVRRRDDIVTGLCTFLGEAVREDILQPGQAAAVLEWLSIGVEE